MIAERKPFRAHAFEYACATNDVDHRLTKPKHPWTNGQVERINRTIKDATVKRYFYETHEQLRTHLRDFVDAYNFARRLKTLKGLTPYEFVCKAWTSQPQRFKLNPLQQMPGLNTSEGNGTAAAPCSATKSVSSIICVTRPFGTGRSPRVHLEPSLGSTPSRYESRYGVRPARSSRSRSSSGDMDRVLPREGAARRSAIEAGQIVKLSVVTIVAMLLSPIH